LISKLAELLVDIKHDFANCSGWVDYPNTPFEGKQVGFSDKSLVATG
jgi:hypothetical protein